MTPPAHQCPTRLRIYSLLAVLVVAYIVRVLYFFQMRDSALFEVLMGDGYAYDQWAKQIAAGDWYGHKVFYQAPMYPYFLGAIYAHYGPHLVAIRIVQTLIGAMSCVMLAQAGIKFFSFRVGITAGLIMAVYGPAVFFDGLIQKPVLSVFFTVLLLLLLAQTANSPRSWRLGAVGVVLGMFALTRENALVLAPIIALWVLFYFHEITWPKRLAWLAAMVVGMALVLVPVGLRNRDIGGSFLITTAQMGPNFYIGNNPGATGGYQPLRAARGDARVEQYDAGDLAQQAMGHQLSAAEISRYWMSQSLDYIGAQPLRWLTLMGKKLAMVFNAREVVDSQGIEAAMEESSLLAVLGRVVHFGVIGPLAVLGVCLTWHDRRRLGVLYGIVLAVAGSTAMFYIFARYRMPIVPVTILFAAVAIVHLIDKKGEAGWRMVLVLLVSAIIMNWPMGDSRASRAISWQNAGLSFYQLGEYGRANEQFQRVLKIFPGSAKAHRQLGKTDRALGRYQSAIEHYALALESSANMANAHNELGELMAITGHFDQALQCWRSALRIAPDHPLAAVHLSWLDAYSVGPKEAVARCDRAIEIARLAQKQDMLALMQQARQIHLKRLNQE